jgi:hypothetical protein
VAVAVVLELQDLELVALVAVEMVGLALLVLLEL